jgi:hypothetical protein
MPDVSSGAVAPPSRRVTGPDAAHGSLPRPLTKLGFHTRTQLAAWAHEEGLLPGKYVGPT